jgi:hypothetical protein
MVSINQLPPPFQADKHQVCQGFDLSEGTILSHIIQIIDLVGSLSACPYPVVFEAEQAIEFDNDEEDEDPTKAGLRGDLIEKLIRDAGAEGASAEEKADVLGQGGH